MRLSAALGVHALLAITMTNIARHRNASSGSLVSAVDNDRVGVGRDGVRGLFVTASVSAGEPLLAIPAPATFVASATPELKAHEALALRLLELTCEQNPYVASLPTDISMLRDWSDAELAQLRAPWLSEAAKSQRAFVDAMVERLLPRAAPMYGGDEAAARAALRWAESIVRSRTHGWSAPDGSARTAAAAARASG